MWPQACDEEDYVVSDKLRTFARSRFAGIISSQAAEDGFNLAKNSKVVKGKRKFRRPEKSFAVMLAKGLVDKIHDYDGVAGDVSVGRKRIRLSKAAFQPDVAAASFPFGKIVTTASTTTYYSPAATNFCKAQADHQLLRDAASSSWKMVQGSFVSSLCSASHKLLLSPVGSDRWYFAMSNWSSSASLVWPALKIQLNDAGAYCFEPDLSAQEPVLMSLCDFDSHQAVTYTWRSPLYFKTHFPASGLAPGVRALPDGPPLNLKEAAALKAFWTLPKTTMVLIAKSLGVDTGTSSLFDVLFSVVKHCASKGDEEVMTILLQRLAFSQMASQWSEDLAEIDEAKQVLDRHDARIVEEEQQRVKQMMFEDEVFSGDFKAKHSELEQKKKKKKKTDAATDKKPTEPKDASTLPKKLPRVASEIEHATVKHFAPAGGYLWRDRCLNSWCAQYKPWPPVRRSWVKYGEPEALRLCIAHLWEKHCFSLDLPKSACPFEGVWAAAAAPASSSSAIV